MRKREETSFGITIILFYDSTMYYNFMKAGNENPFLQTPFIH
jgi:hypothetical protein